jgi:hypothetical protein
MRAACEFESEMLAAVLESRWPEGVDAQLRQHVSTCTICAETALVACAIGDDREQARTSARIPDSGRVWWLAQLRSRREAIAAAERPITIAQMIAFACATGLLGACFGAASVWFQSALRRVVASLAEHPVLAAATAMLVLVIPLLSYFALERESRNARQLETTTERATSAPR